MLASLTILQSQGQTVQDSDRPCVLVSVKAQPAVSWTGGGHVLLTNQGDVYSMLY